MTAVCRGLKHMHTMMDFSPVKYVSPPHGYIRYVPSLLQHNEDETLHVPQMGVKEGFQKGKRLVLFLMSHLSWLHMEEMGGRRRKLKDECRTRARKGLTYQQEFNTRSPRPLLEPLQTHCCGETDHDATRLNETLGSDGHCECVRETAVSISHRFVRLLWTWTQSHKHTHICRVHL